MAQDLELITNFMEKSLKREDVIIESSYLKAHTICKNNQLLAKNEGLVAAIHLAHEPPCFVVKLKSLYWELINQLLTDKHFIPQPSQNTGDFYHYQYCEIPPTYEVSCDKVGSLWKTWWIRNKHYKKSVLSLDFLIRTRDSWYPIQEIKVLNQVIFIHTLGSKIPLNETDVVVWLRKL
ncbi:MAG: hypothetical protein F6K16_32195 [Symploca sp. SIO2B6]|nr:hypothetical protein [Symploca sp. SIO2B6]